jgi:hypothetical protein
MSTDHEADKDVVGAADTGADTKPATRTARTGSTSLS